MMGDSQSPKPALPPFEVPDLELELPPRSAAKLPAVPQAPERSAGAHNSFEEDVFADGLSIELDDARAHAAVQVAARKGFDVLAAVELERNALPELAIDSDMEHSAARASVPRVDAVQWPSAATVPRDPLAIDPVQVATIAAYPEPPKSVYLTPAYAFRVFTRQRELKRVLGLLEIERVRADAEQSHALAELGRAVRSEADKIPQFSRFVRPLVELEQVAAARNQALSSVNAELANQTASLDAELSAIASDLLIEQERERSAQRMRDDREAAARRAEAKLKRVLIESRAVTQVAEQKLGPQAGTISEPEAAQLAALKQRAEAVQPELNHTRIELEQAEATLNQATARLDAARQRERHALRKKQALAEHYRKDLDVRGRGFNESEERHRAALADLGRAALAEQTSVLGAEGSLELVRHATKHADALSLRCELQRRALSSYDRARAAQGVRLACTGLALIVFLVVLKLAL